MNYFSAISKADRVCFEGNEIVKIIPLRDRKTDTISHYKFSVRDPDEGATFRTFRSDEIPHLLESELLVVDKGYYSLARQTDRALYDDNHLAGAGKKQRARVDRILFLCRRMEHYYQLGMPLTPKGVEQKKTALAEDYKKYQARIRYDTEAANCNQDMKSLPANTTLLDYYRKFRKGQQNPMVFIPPRSKPVDHDHIAANDFHFILGILNEYADAAPVAKCEVAAKAVEEAKKENERRKAAGFPNLIKVKSARQYERWIDMYLDPFTVCIQRKGLAAAKAKFGSVERGMSASFPGEQVQFDAWKVHVITLNTTRERYNNMTVEQRSKVKRVRRWVVVGLDIATRAILGFAFCTAPNQEASLQALRMCFADKTDMLKDAGLNNTQWNFRAPLHLVSTDSGNEFGRHPFGGAQFGEAVRRLSGTLLNATTGVPELRGYIERLFLTFELKWARHLYGATAGAVHLRNDRKPSEEACITDDELHRLFVQFIDEYHKSPHRGLAFATPAGTWEKLSKNSQFDPTQLPGPKALREACGAYQTAGISDSGIRWMNLTYSNGIVRDQRMATGADQFTEANQKLEIMIDPLDIGAISILAGGDLISVPCLDDDMRGKSLAWWKGEQSRRKAEAADDVAAHAEARSNAGNAWRGEAAAIATSQGKKPIGHTDEKVAQMKREFGYGKGAHEQPFVGRDEYADPVSSGFEIGRAPDAEDEITDTAPEPSVDSLDRFRSKTLRRSPKPSGQGENT
ncbi:hypothetical protein [Sulfitobacter sp. 1A15106]|uniref:hypothetical protein n=1 Tax=Sulfitobacter sp. 1A15106 TaxID=3368590 RepID=UPI0037456571